MTWKCLRQPHVQPPATSPPPLQYESWKRHDFCQFVMKVALLTCLFLAPRTLIVRSCSWGVMPFQLASRERVWKAIRFHVKWSSETDEIDLLHQNLLPLVPAHPAWWSVPLQVMWRHETHLVQAMQALNLRLSFQVSQNLWGQNWQQTCWLRILWCKHTSYMGSGGRNQFVD